MDDNPHLQEHTLSWSTNASHEDAIVFLLSQGITSSASRPKIPRKKIFHNFYQKKGVDLHFAGCCI